MMKKWLVILCLLLLPVSAWAGTRVVIKTNLGEIEVELNEAKAPISTANFLSYVDDGFYSGTIFHRVIPNFMIQGGGFTKNLARKITKAEIRSEAMNGLKNKRGTIAMARTSVIDSATSQFFINHKDNSFLDHKSKTQRGFGYAVFGEVTRGMEVVDQIASLPTGRKKGMSDVPVQPVIIEAVERIAPE